MPEIWLLVFFTSGAGVITEQFESEGICNAAKEILAEEYLPDWDEDTWTSNVRHPRAYKRSKCFEIEEESNDR